MTASLVLAAVLTCLYSVSLGHNFLFDEENIILKNPLVRDLGMAAELFRSGYFHFDAAQAGQWNHYYRPLTALSFALDYRVWKLDPFGYNLTNLLLQLAAALMLLRLAGRSCGSWAAAFAATLAWSAHPAHTETVTYIASRGDLLAGVALLGALLAYRAGRFAAAAAVYAAALWTKESAILIPLALWALDVSLVRSSKARLAGRMAVLAALAAVYLALRHLATGQPFVPPGDPASGGLLRVFSMGPAFVRYLHAIVLPEPFKFAESVRFASRWSDPSVIQSAAIAAAAAASGVLAWKRRGPWFLGWALFWIGSIPYSQYVHFYPEWAEHYLYVPSMGLTVLAAAALTRAGRGSPARLAALVCAVILPWTAWCAARTWQRNDLYNDTRAYYERLAASDSPYASYGYQNLADLAMREKDWGRAFVWLRTAEAIQPSSDVTQNYLGLCRLDTGRPDLALGHFLKAYEYNGNHFGYLNNAGIALMRLDRHEEAVATYERIHALAPAYAPAYTNGLVAFELSGRPKEGLERCEEGLKQLRGRDLESAAVLMAMVRTAYRSEDRPEAIRTARRLAREHPDAFWYADAARLLTGELPEETFRRKLESEYAPYGHELAGRSYLLMAHVLSGRRERLAESYASIARSLEDSPAGDNPLIRRELEIARDALEGDRVS